MKWNAKLYDEAKAPQLDAGRELIEMAGVREAEAILDLGCGTGVLTAELASLAPRGRVIGIDPSKEMIGKAARRTGSFGNITLMRIAAQSMGFADKFDLVFSNSALQWVKEQREVLGLVRRALKPGGRVAFQLPARDFCKEFFQYSGNAIAGLGLGEYYRDWESPWYLPSKEQYEALLEEAGFEDVDVKCRDYGLVFEGINDVLLWWASAGLRPILGPLPKRQREYFKYAFAMSFEKNRTERGIEFGFRRLFVLARRGR